MNPAERPRFLTAQLHLLVLLLASTAVLGRLITITPEATVVWRSALASLGAFFLCFTWRKCRVVLPSAVIGKLIGIGAVIGVHWICFFGSVKAANISIGLAGLATLSFFTAFTEAVFERRAPRAIEVACGVLVLGGILLISGYTPGYRLGLGLALAGAFLAALFPVFNRSLVRLPGMDPLVIVAWEMIGAGAVSLLALVLFPDRTGGLASLAVVRGADVFWLLLLGWACTVFAHGFQIHLLRYFTAYAMNLAFNLEAVYGIAAAVLFFGEHHHLNAGFFAGTAAILLANVIEPWMRRRRARRAAAGYP